MRCMIYIPSFLQQGKSRYPDRTRSAPGDRAAGVAAEDRPPTDARATEDKTQMFLLLDFSHGETLSGRTQDTPRHQAHRTRMLPTPRRRLFPQSRRSSELLGRPDAQQRSERGIHLRCDRRFLCYSPYFQIAGTGWDWTDQKQAVFDARAGTRHSSGCGQIVSSIDAHASAS